MSEDLETYTMTLQEERDYYCKCMRELQQENEQFKEKIKRRGEYIKEQQQKIDKAIKHIKENTKNDTFCEWYDGEVKDLLEILGGKE